MVLKAGYKQTEIGMIPDDWDSRRCSELSDLITVGIVVRPTQYYVKQGVPALRSANVREQGIVNTEMVFISEKSNALLSKSQLRAGDVLTVRTGYPGTSAVVPPLFAGANCIDVLITRPSKEVCPTFLSAWINSSFGKFQVLRNQGGLAQQHFNVSDLRNLIVAIPPNKNEQEAIAAALTEADALIESLERLLAKKRNLKQGAMQELLTGKKRLPGFSGEWTTRRLGDVIASCSSGATPYRGRSDFYRGSVKWITSGELNFDVIVDTLEHISREAVQRTNLKIHPAGTFLMAITGLEAAGTRGACGIVGSPATTNQSCMAIYPTTDLQTEYLYHYYVYRGNELAFEYCQGTKQQSYTAKLVRLLPIDLPPSTEEQAAIASILSEMDAEIAALEAKLAKARLLKLGMMQQLLTGKIRLV